MKDEVSENRNFIKTREKESEVHRSSTKKGKVFGKRGRGRPRKRSLEYIEHRMQIRNYRDIKGAALDRREWLRLQDIAIICFCTTIFVIYHV